MVICLELNLQKTYNIAEQIKQDGLYEANVLKDLLIYCGNYGLIRNDLKVIVAWAKVFAARGQRKRQDRFEEPVTAVYTRNMQQHIIDCNRIDLDNGNIQQNLWLLIDWELDIINELVRDV